MSTIKILLIGRKSLLREGLRRLLNESEFTVLVQADGVAEASNIVRDQRSIDLVLIHLPGSEAPEIAGIGQLRQQMPDLRIVALTEDLSFDLMAEVFQAGADGFLLSDLTPGALSHALHLVMEGERVLPSDTVGLLLERQRRSERIPLTASVLHAAPCSRDIGPVCFPVAREWGSTERRCDVTVAISGRETLVRQGLRELLRGSEFRVTADTATLEELLTGHDRHQAERPDLIILLEFRGEDSYFAKTVRTLGETWPETRVVVLANDQCPSHLLCALDLDINAYLDRGISRKTLLRSLELVMLGECVFPAKPAVHLMEEIGNRAGAQGEDDAVACLSNRETEILLCLVGGQPNKIISRQLGISEAKVKVQVRSLLRKIGVENRTQAAVWALSHGVGNLPASNLPPANDEDSLVLAAPPRRALLAKR